MKNLRDALLLTRFNRNRLPSAFGEVGNPRFGGSRLREVVTAEYGEAAARTDKLVEHGVRVAAWRARVDHFHDDVDQLEVLADTAHRADHVAGVPLDDLLEVLAHSLPAAA